MAVLNKKKPSGFLKSLRRNQSEQVNPDELFHVGDDAPETALDIVPVKDATGALDVAPSQIVEVIPGAKPHEQSIMVPIDDVYIPAPDEEGNMQHPRREVDQTSDDDLEASMREHGILVPLIVRPTNTYGSRRLAVIKGSRRLERARKLGMTHVPVIVRMVTRRAAFRMTYVMTAHNQFLSGKEKGLALAQMHRDMEAELQEFLKEHRLLQRDGRPLKMNEADWEARKAQIRQMPLWIEKAVNRAVNSGRRVKVTSEEMTELTGQTRQQLHRLSRLAELPDKLIEDISSSQAMALSTLQTPEQQLRLAREIKRNNLTARQTQQRVQEMLGRTPSPGTTRTVHLGEAGSGKPENDPVHQLREAVRAASRGAELLEKGTSSEEYRAHVLREIEVLELQLERLRKVIQ